MRERKRGWEKKRGREREGGRRRNIKRREREKEGEIQRKKDGSRGGEGLSLNMDIDSELMEPLRRWLFTGCLLLVPVIYVCIYTDEKKMIHL